MIDENKIVLNKMFLAAKSVRDNAYAPYSNYHVGAALKIKGQQDIISGCNVENASFGGTICAERNAILHSVALAGGKVEIESMVIITDNEEPATPCGMCLQVMSEFCTKDTPIHLANLKGIQKEFKFVELFPNVFDSSKLEE